MILRTTIITTIMTKSAYQIQTLDTNVIPMSYYRDTINDPYYKETNERLGITLFAENYYVASSNLNKYSFSMIEDIKTDIQNRTESGQSLYIKKRDVHTMFFLYHLSREQSSKPSL